MNLNDWLRGVAGFLVVVSLALGYLVHPAFLLFTGFVGLNLVQSAFSKTCPMMAILKMAGVRER